MDLITLRDIDLGFGGDPLLEKLSLRVVGGERVCLLGRNGSGKTSLLRVLMGDLQADGGEIIRQPTIRIAGLPQSVRAGISKPWKPCINASTPRVRGMWSNASNAP
jgi:ATP-binding cassette subfamily F protein uup